MNPRPPAADSETALSSELTILDMGAEGEGMARLGDRALYLAGALPGERVTARIKGDKAEVTQILQPSPDRVAAPCPHFGVCGGCALQHWRDGAYAAWKLARLQRLLGREGLSPDFLPTFQALPGQRRRLALHARRAERGGGARLGFKEKGAWTLVDITQCVVATPGLNAALPALAKLASAFLGHAKSAPTLHVTETETGLDIDVTGVESGSRGFSGDQRGRVCEVAAAHDFARVTLSGETLYSARPPRILFDGVSVALPPGSFLQAVAAAERQMAQDACEALQGAKKVADFFCGAGAFSFPLAKQAQVFAFDSALLGIAALKQAAGEAPGRKAVSAEVRDLFRRPLSVKEMKGFDGALFDPPRAGASAQAEALARSDIPTVVGVSCNPATFVRDAKILVGGGYRLTRIRLVDQFLWSAHMEVVGTFEK